MGRRRYTEEQFREAVADPTVTTIAELCRRLGVMPSGGNYESLKRYAERLGLSHVLAQHQSRGHPRQPDLSDTTRVAEVVARSRSIAQAIERLGGEPSTRSRRQLRGVIESEALDTSHMLGQGWARGQRLPRARVPVAELFERSWVSTTTLRRKLIAEGYKDHRCEACGQRSWQGQPIPLELDHIDGDRTNNRRENLRLLCPNCHALTPTYRGRNIGQH